jgi:hypothetical protein
MIEAALAVALAAPASPHFTPPLGKPLTCVITEARDLGAQHFAFSSTRHVVFRREGDGYLALLTIEHGSDAPAGGVGAMFQAALAGLAGRTIRLHLDASGEVTRIDDLDALWQRFVAQIAAMGDTPDRARRTAAMATALGQLPTPERRAMIGSLLDKLVAGKTADARPGSDTTVAVEAQASGGPVGLVGRQHAAALPGDRLDLRVTAEGPAADGHVSLSRDTVIDRATGLVVSSRQVQTMTMGSQHGTTTSTMTLTLPVS